MMNFKQPHNTEEPKNTRPLGSGVADCCAAGGNNMPHYLSFGGGVNSVALYLLMEQLGIEFEAIFVDHGGDYPETYEYVNYFISTGRPVTVLKPNYRGFTDLLSYCQHYNLIPFRRFRWCTSHFKVAPMVSYYKKSSPCFVHIGIEHRWLLIEHDINRQGCKDLISKAGLEVPPKSGCFFCPFQRPDQWRYLRREHPELFCVAKKLESAAVRAREIKGKGPTFFYRDSPLERIINTAPNLWPELDYPPCQCGL